MHEVSLAQSLLDIVQQYAVDRGFVRVDTLRLSCGKLSCVVPESLRFAFEMQAKGTPAESAQLVLDLLPARIYCFNCEKEFEVENVTAECPQCCSVEVVMVGGTEELKLIEMDVHTPQD